MKFTELKSLTAPELEAKGRDLRQEMFNLRLRQTAGQLEKPSRLHELRRTIARIETLLNQPKSEAKTATKSEPKSAAKPKRKTAKVAKTA